ncbi:MAG: HTH domain-containing protein, partial [Mesorhizobium sp.]
MLTLLELLKDGRFHSGQTLGVALGISRSAVWKQLQHLEAELGLSVHKVRGKGYQLAKPLVLLNMAEIGAEEPCQWPVHIFDSID